MAKKQPKMVVQDGVPVVVPGVTFTFRIVRWLICAALIGLAIGSLAIYDQRLDSIPVAFNTTDPTYIKYSGRTINIQYCLLSNNAVDSQPVRCNFGYASAAVSLGTSLTWATFLAVRKSFIAKAWLQKSGDILLNLFGAAWWVASGVPLSIWTNEANVAHLPSTNWRNTICFFAWLMFVLFCVGVAMSAILLSDKLQIKWFTKKPKAPKAPQGGVAAAAPAAAAGPPQAGAPGAAPPQQQGAWPPPVNAGAAAPPQGAWPQGGGPSGAGAAGPAPHAALPVSSGAPAQAAPAQAAADDNPFRAGAPAAVGPQAV